MSRKEQAKALYIAGQKPAQIASELGYQPNTISRWASTEEWDQERNKKAQETTKDFEEQIKELTRASLQALTEVIKDGKYSDRVAAARVVIDISGLKREKQEVDLTTGGIEVIINQIPVK